MKPAYLQPIIIFSLVAGLLNTLFFFGLDAQQFIFSGDQFFRFSTHEAFTDSFFLRKPIDLGVLNGWQFITQFWDELYYLIVYHFGLTPIPAEKLLFFLVLFLSLFLSFLGFNKIAHRFEINSGLFNIYVVTFWYCFNPYTLELWHGGVYNLGSGLTYSLAPLIFYYFNEAIFSVTDKSKILCCALLIAAASFTFWLVAPLVFFIALYTILRIAINPGIWRLAAKNIILLAVVYFPLVAFILFGITHEYFNNFGNVNSGFLPTFGNMQGGIWYQLNMMFSWGIYTVWTPRTMYPFGDYFFSKTYITAIVLLYVLILLGLFYYFARHISQNNIKQNGVRNFLQSIVIKCLARIQDIGVLGKSSSKSDGVTHQLIVLALVFMFSVFLAKGAQPPLGEIFLFLYNHVPFFNVFRTPDIRFGFSMVLSLALLLLFISRAYNKRIFPYVLAGLTLVLAWPFFAGDAVRGANRNGLYYDRIVNMPDSYTNLAAYINKHAIQSSYILPIPAVEYGHYLIGSSEDLIGQDMVAKISNAPFVYISQSGGMSTNTYEKLKNIIDGQHYDNFRDFPIRYVLLRKDICPDCPLFPKEKLAEISNLVYQDPVFSLYEMSHYRSVIDSPNVNFERISSVKYRVNFKNITKPQELTLLQNFNKDWKIFLGSGLPRENCLSKIRNDFSMTSECIRESALFEMDDLKYLWQRPLFESSHLIKFGYANNWVVDPQYLRINSLNSDYSINPDGSLNFTLVVYYQPEIGYLLSGAISLISVITMLCILMYVGFIQTRKLFFNNL